MIKGIGVWLIGILSCIFISILLDLLMGHSKLYKFIKTLCNTIMILVIISPLPFLVKKDFSFDNIDQFIQLDNNYISSSQNIRNNYLEKGVENVLSDDGIEGVVIHLTTVEKKGEFIIKKVEANIDKLVIDDKYEHINKYELIKDKISLYLNIDKGIIYVK